MKRAIDAVLAQPWAIADGWLDTIADIATRESEYHGNLEALEAKLGRPLGNTMKTTVRDGVAVIPFEGPLFRRANLMTEYSGASSYDTLATDFTAALEDPSVKAIIGYFDTPGGQVNGASELAAMIAAARGKKPMVAFAGGTMASAGLWIGSAFDRIVAADTAIVGSVGAQAGYTVREPKPGEKSYRFVSSQSPLKNADPGTEAGAAESQKMVNDLAQVFIDSLAANRGTTSEKVLELYGQGAVFVAGEALKRGMIDAIGTFENLFSQLSNEVKSMDFASLTVASLTDNRPDLVKAISDQAVASIEKPDLAAIRAEGAEAERKRIAGIEALSMPGAEEVIAAAKADASATPESTAMKVLAAVRENPAAAKPATGAAALEAIKKTEAELDAPTPSAGAEGGKKDDPVAFAIAAAQQAGVFPK